MQQILIFLIFKTKAFAMLFFLTDPVKSSGEKWELQQMKNSMS